VELSKCNHIFIVTVAAIPLAASLPVVRVSGRIPVPPAAVSLAGASAVVVPLVTVRICLPGPFAVFIPFEAFFAPFAAIIIAASLPVVRVGGLVPIPPAAVSFTCDFTVVKPFTVFCGLPGVVTFVDDTIFYTILNGIIVVAASLPVVRVGGLVPIPPAAVSFAGAFAIVVIPVTV